MATAELVNPFREGLRLEGATHPCQLVIFGASGDLTKRKLLPAIYNLAQASLLPPSFAVVGFARAQMSDDQFRDVLREAVNSSGEVRVRDAGVLENLAQRCYYIAGDFHDASSFRTLKTQLEELDKRYGTGGSRIFYTATPASLYGSIAQNLHDCGLTAAGVSGSNTAGVSGSNAAGDGSVSAAGSGSQTFVRIIVEKPFGHDLATAKALNAELLTYLREDQIYRIDHYLGKETVQNILALRFANGIFEPVWNRRYVDSVQITVAESLGLEGRGSFYEETGVVRDVIQNHALQLLSLVGMEPPNTFDARDFRDEKIRVVEAVHPIAYDHVEQYAVRGQYGAGFVAGERAPGYREEPNVARDSITPTYAAFKFSVDNWRWAGVPFYVRSGKRLPKRVTEIGIQFKEAPHLPFRKSQVETPEGNVLALRIQPDEGITLKFAAKVPGPIMRIRSVAMDFAYGATFGAEDASPYERLILDCMKGDQTLFDRADGVEAAWALVDPILKYWEEHRNVKFPNYAAGTWGPPEADALLARDGKSWRRV